MFYLYLALAITAILLVVVGMIDPELLLFKARRGFRRKAKLVYLCTLIVFILAFGISSAFHKAELRKIDSSIKPVTLQVPEEVQEYNQVLSDFKSQGILLKAMDPAETGIPQNKDVKQVNGSNQDDSLTLSVYQDSKTGIPQAYKLYTADATVPAMKMLIKDVLPGWSTGANWIDLNLDNEDEVSTTYKDALVDLVANRSSDEPGYLLQIYPHGYVNL